MITYSADKYHVCLLDNKCNSSYTVVNDKKYINNGQFDTKQFEIDHPGQTVTAVFNSETDLLMSANKEKTEFRLMCYDYGFRENDYGRYMNDARFGTSAVIFVGFLPKNRKYKALLYNTVTRRHIKATINYVRSHII